MTYYYDPTVAPGRGVNTIVGPDYVAKHGIPRGATLRCEEGGLWEPIPDGVQRSRPATQPKAKQPQPML